MNIPLQSIQDECNRVANIYRNRWRLKLQTAPMTDEGLSPLTYEKGIKELNPPFKLTLPSTVQINILNSFIDELNPIYTGNHYAAAGVHPDLLNPALYVFLPTLELQGQRIVWSGFVNTFQSVLAHEYLHICGDVPQFSPGVIDGVIRHTWIGTEAMINLFGEF